MATYKIVLKKDKTKPDGQVPLYLRITHNRKTTMRSIGVSVLPKDWNESLSKVKPSAKNSARINAIISKEMAEAQKVSIEMELNNSTISAKAIKNKMQKGGDFLQYFKEYVDLLQKEGKHGSYVKAKAVFSKLHQYSGNSGLKFEEVSVTWLKEYEEYLRRVLGNSINTVHSNTKVIRKLFNDAVREDIINPNQNPFYKFKLKTEKTTREYLTEEQLLSFENLEVKKGTAKRIHRDMYVFACYVGGIRISDLLQLKWKNFDGDHIHYTMHKTGDRLSIKVPTKGLEILRQYGEGNHQPEDYVFPPLRKLVEPTDQEIYKAVSGGTAYANKSLIDLAKKAEINKNITFHTSRHTWATRALRKGMRIEYVSKLMGHSKIQTTQIYAKIVNEELDKAMDVFG